MRLVLSALLLAAGLTTACAPTGGAGCRPAAAVAVEAAPKPKPKPGTSAERKTGTCTKATSPIWRNLRPHRGSIRTNGLSGAKQQFYEWDNTHADIEVYDHNGKHLGSMDPASGKMIKPPVRSRTLKGLR